MSQVGNHSVASRNITKMSSMTSDMPPSDVAMSPELNKNAYKLQR
jgi:hypothetical protein